MPDNRRSNFIRQGTILAMASILVRIIGIIYRIPVGRIIGDEGDGIYGAAYEVYNFALILSSYSLPLAVSKLLSAKLAVKEYRDSQKTFMAISIFSCISGGVMALLIFFGADFLERTFYEKYTGIAVPLRVLAITIFVVALLGVLRGFFQARKTMIPTAISQIIEQIINAICSIAFAYTLYNSHKDLTNASSYGAAGSTMGTLFGAIAGLIFLIFVYIIYQPILKNQLRRDHSGVESSYGEIYKALLLTIIPVIVGQTIYQASGLIDSMIFSKFSQLKDDVFTATYGVYGSRYKLLVNLPVAVATAMATSMIPTFVSLHTNNDYASLKNKLAISVKVNMIIAIPSAAGLMALGGPIIHLLFPKSNYVLAGKLLLLGGVAVIFFALSTVTNAALQGINLMRKPMINAAISLVIHIPLVILLLVFTRLEVYALVIGNATYPLVVCILNWIDIDKNLNYRQELKTTFIIPAISSAIMGVAAFLSYKLLLLLTHSNAISCIIAMGIAVIIYFVLIFLLKGLTSDDLPDFPMGLRIGKVARKLHLL